MMRSRPSLFVHSALSCAATTRRQALRWVAAGTAALLLAGCGQKEEQVVGSAPAPARVFVVATDAAYAPFESQNERGEIVGFDIDLMRAIALQAGFDVRFVNTPWEGIFNGLQQGDSDIVISAVGITDERRQSMDYSEPYFDAVQLIAVRQDSPVAAAADLVDLTVGVQTGTTGDEAVKNLLGKDSTRIRRFETTTLALKELEAGGVDAVVADNGVIDHYVANNPGGSFRSVSDDNFVPEQYGIVVRRGNTELLQKINEGLTAVRADGTYDRIYTRWFGGSTAEPRR